MFYSEPNVVILDEALWCQNIFLIFSCASGIHFFKLQIRVLLAGCVLRSSGGALPPDAACIRSHKTIACWAS